MPYTTKHSLGRPLEHSAAGAVRSTFFPFEPDTKFYEPEYRDLPCLISSHREKSDKQWPCACHHTDAHIRTYRSIHGCPIMPAALTHTHTHDANASQLYDSTGLGCASCRWREVPTPVRRLGPLSHHAGLAHEPRQTHPEAEHLPATQEAALTAAAAGRGWRCNLMARAG